MSFANIPRERWLQTLRWAARIFSVLLFLLWGAFFIEHLSWFRGQESPPLWVWFLQAVHLVLLLSFLAALRWEVLGCCSSIISALIFFAQVADRNFLPFFGVSIVPALLFLLCHWLERTPAASPWKGGLT